MGKKITNILLLQAVIVIFSITSVLAKFASEQEFLSGGFVLFYGLEVMVLGIYAVCWQQIIKRFDISVAYANKATVLLWGAVWSRLIFNEVPSPRQFAAMGLVIAGVVILNLSGNSAGEGSAA
ncbi:MAG: transporter [Lachnospiraceae bacterium]|nr:transporter [Lachnospiraceae bacterium]